MSDNIKPTSRYLKEMPLHWANFSGMNGDYPNEMNSDIGIRFEDPEIFEELRQEGWPVVERENQKGELKRYLKLKINKDPNRGSGKGPNFLIVKGNKAREIDTTKDQNALLELDDYRNTRIKYVDVLFSPYDKEHDGIVTSAWVNKIRVYIDTDEFDDDLGDVEIV